MDEATLIRRAAAGDRHAFGILVRAHQEGVFLWVHRMVRDEEDAHDLTQETFVRAFRGIGGFRGDAALGTWLRTIATNLVVSQLRREGSATFVPLVDELVADEAAPDAGVIGEDQRRKLAGALERLPPRQREVVRLRIYDELPYAEIAVRLSCSENSAKVSFHHAVKRLRTLLHETTAQRPGLESSHAPEPAEQAGASLRHAPAP
jgi:RNA polymerase sigma-70 factor (ECF subfamily)